MKLSKILFVVSAASLSISSFAQTEIEKSSTFKAYTNYQNTSVTTRLSTDSFNNTFIRSRQNMTEFGSVTPAFTWSRSFRHNEVELSRLQISKMEWDNTEFDDSTGKKIQTLAGNVNNTFVLRLRFETNWEVFPNRMNDNVIIMLGSFFSPYFYRSVNWPQNSISFANRDSEWGTNFGVMPRLQYVIRDKWVIDFNLPISLAEMNVHKRRVENPSFSADQRTQTTGEFRINTNGFAARFGLGIRI